MYAYFRFLDLSVVRRRGKIRLFKINRSFVQKTNKQVLKSSTFDGRKPDCKPFFYDFVFFRRKKLNSTHSKLYQFFSQKSCNFQNANWFCPMLQKCSIHRARGNFSALTTLGSSRLRKTSIRELADI